MNISPWEIYWVMQLDHIRIILAFAVAVGASAGVIAWIDGELEAVLSHGKLVALWGMLATFLVIAPSTKTAAAMIVIPKIANNESVQREAVELYSLAKQALRDAVDAPKDGGK